MKFSYEAYRVSCFLTPLCNTLLALIVFLILAIVLIFLKKKNKLSRSNIIAFVVTIVVAFFYISLPSIGVLFSGGIWLHDEEETEVDIITGEITDIQSLTKFSFPKVSVRQPSRDASTLVGGIKLTVNGTKCTMPGVAGLEVGDTVKVVYLTKSGYILQVMKE